MRLTTVRPTMCVYENTSLEIGALVRQNVDSYDKARKAKLKGTSIADWIIVEALQDHVQATNVLSRQQSVT